MFERTFHYYASFSTGGTIPSDLFARMDISGGTNITNMFWYPFYEYARRSATFIDVGGNVVETRVFTNPYLTKDLAATPPTPSTSPTITASSIPVPTYSATNRNIVAPAGVYAATVVYTAVMRP